PTEAELSQRYNISRSVTREAVKMLTAKGLLASRPRQGIRIMPSSHWNMFDTDVLAWTLHARPSLDLLREFTQLRIAIEPEAACLAANNSDDTAKIRQITEALARIKKANEGMDDSLAAIIEFHCSILTASNNRFFLQLRQFITVALRVNMTHIHQLKGSFVGTYEHHKKIHDAILYGNGTAAADAMKSLLSEFMAVIDSSMMRTA
ncbi:MAG: FadR family transcriptional regulator, partial [Moraxellaceae bacterium]